MPRTSKGTFLYCTLELYSFSFYFKVFMIKKNTRIWLDSSIKLWKYSLASIWLAVAFSQWKCRKYSLPFENLFTLPVEVKSWKSIALCSKYSVPFLFGIRNDNPTNFSEGKKQNLDKSFEIRLEKEAQLLFHSKGNWNVEAVKWNFDIIVL